MKIRSGFVSNSSSSSFMIATKDEVDEKILRKLILDAFKVDPDSPIYYIVEQAAALMLDSQKYTLEELMDEKGYSSQKEFLDDRLEIKEAINKGFTKIYQGSAGSEGDTAEQLLCDLDIHYEDENILIEKDGGF